jgi:hypothetical protein
MSKVPDGLLTYTRIQMLDRSDHPPQGLYSDNRYRLMVSVCTVLL